MTPAVAISPQNVAFRTREFGTQFWKAAEALSIKTQCRTRCDTQFRAYRHQQAILKSRCDYDKEGDGEAS